MSALTKSQRREVAEEEAKARGLMADIVPLLNDLPTHSLPENSVHLGRALEAAKAATRKLKNGEPTP